MTATAQRPEAGSARRLSRLLERYRLRIDRALVVAIAERHGAPAAIHEAMRYSVMGGGKRLRPILCLLACEAVGGRSSAALDTACGLELIHTYSLIHDDLPAMDDAATRRGRASSHRKFGEATAILAGDALLTLAFELIARGRHPARSLRVVREVARWAGTQGLIGGQVLDLRSQNGHRLLAPPAAGRVPVLDAIAARKTAALMCVSVRAGAIVGGASDAQLRALSRYGEAVGMTFQMVDDLMDGDGYAAVLGRRGTRDRAASHVRRAERALDLVGPRAGTLRALAHRLLDRKT
ncbi:MAG: polyprenyl synthetase family protein [Candidatus Omnitrophica bacterium]|nr:polyprenyl synthetase family protein [Candidatus Omnitrophota bacterium]